MVDLGSINSFYTAYEGSWFWGYANSNSLLKGRLRNFATIEITLKNAEEITFLKMLELDEDVETYLVGIDASNLKPKALEQIAKDLISGEAVSISKEKFLEMYEEAKDDE